MLRRLISVFLILILCSFSVAGCSGLSKNESADSSKSSKIESDEEDDDEDSERASDSDEKESSSEESDSAEQDTQTETLVAAKPMYSDNGELLCGISFTADQTQFFIGDEGYVTLTVSFPENIYSGASIEGVQIKNDEGTEIGTFLPEEFILGEDGRYSASGVFQMETQTNRTFLLKAYSGEFYSPVLMLTVTPHITADQIADCVVIGAELNDAMAADFADVDAKERAAGAKDWLDNDSRILCTDLSADETLVYYVTADYITGAFNAAGIEESDDPLKDYSGINDGSSWEYIDAGLLTDLYQEYEFDPIEKNNMSLYMATNNSAVSTDPDALLLIPCPEHMGAGRDEYIASLTADINAYVQATGGQATILRGTDAVRAILNQELNEYGLVTLFTHGSIMDGQFMRNNHNKETIYLMYRSDAFTDDTKDSIHEDAKAKLKEFAQIAYESDSQGKNSEDSFYSQFYSEPWTISLASYTRKMILATAFAEGGNKYEIWMTDAFFADRYQDQCFDNTVIYLATCKGLLDSEFDEWLISHGCRYVFGFTVFVNTISNIQYHSELIRLMTESTNDHPNRFRVAREATEEIGVVDPADWGLDSEDVDPPVWFTWIGPLTSSYSADIPSGSRDNTLYYVGQNDFLFKGTGELKGHVKWKDPADDTADPAELEPIQGATVKAYLLKNRTFTEFPGNEVTTDENGAFSIQDCPMGYLILVATAEGNESDPYQAYFVDDTWDGGDLLIERADALTPSACIGKYKGQIYTLGQSVAELKSLDISPAKYQYICSFAFYNGKLYYCCKEGGTSDYHMALYEANPDGSDPTELYDPMDINKSNFNRFVLSDNYLYFRDAYWSGSTLMEDYYKIDLTDGSVSAAPDAPEEVRRSISSSGGYYEYNKMKFYASGGSSTSLTKTIVMENEDGSTETLVDSGRTVRLEAVLLADTLDDLYIYYSTFDGSGQNAELYRMKFSTRQSELVDSHMAVGGGIYFNW